MYRNYDHDFTRVKLFEGMGRGLFCNLDLTEFHAQIKMPLSYCEILVLSHEDTVITNRTELKHYTFKYNETQDCLVLGNGELFNHSDTPNVSYGIEQVDGRSMMVFRLIKPVLAGEQLFIDYNQDVQVETKEYVASKSLIG